MTNKKRATRPLEEDVEFSNVTKFRNSLLGAVERVQKNPAKRYVITKHGAPEAVLMSYQTYSLLSKVMEQGLKAAEGQSREEAIRSAFARLRQERQPDPSEDSSAVSEDSSADAELETSPSIPAELGLGRFDARRVPWKGFYTLRDAKMSAIRDRVQAIRLECEALDSALNDQPGRSQTQGKEHARKRS